MKKLLVVEDEQNLREGIATAFTDQGWEVSQASSGEEAIRMLEREIYDVMVTDYQMSGSDGIDVLKRCKMINESTVVLMMTAYGTIESAVEAMHECTDDERQAIEDQQVIEKPQMRPREVAFGDFRGGTVRISGRAHERLWLDACEQRTGECCKNDRDEHNRQAEHEWYADALCPVLYESFRTAALDDHACKQSRDEKEG